MKREIMINKANELKAEGFVIVITQERKEDYRIIYRLAGQPNQELVVKY